MRAFLFIAILGLLAAGCTPPAPEDAFDYQAHVAAHLGLFVGLSPDAPAPPVAGDACPNCAGKGTLGDGVVKVVCPACKGTGRKAVAVLVPSPLGGHRARPIRLKPADDPLGAPAKILGPSDQDDPGSSEPDRLEACAPEASDRRRARVLRFFFRRRN